MTTATISSTVIDVRGKFDSIGSTLSGIENCTIAETPSAETMRQEEHIMSVLRSIESSLNSSCDATCSDAENDDNGIVTPIHTEPYWISDIGIKIYHKMDSNVSYVFLGELDNDVTSALGKNAGTAFF